MYTSEYKNIYLHEDLTPLHSKLLKLVKGRDNVKYAFRREYVIDYCMLHNGFKILIKSPDDLFYIGLDEINITDLSLQEIFIYRFLGSLWRGVSLKS